MMEHGHIHPGVTGHSSKSLKNFQEFHQQNGNPENHVSGPLSLMQRARASASEAQLPLLFLRFVLQPARLLAALVGDLDMRF